MKRYTWNGQPVSIIRLRKVNPQVADAVTQYEENHLGEKTREIKEIVEVHNRMGKRIESSPLLQRVASQMRLFVASAKHTDVSDFNPLAASVALTLGMLLYNERYHAFLKENDKRGDLTTFAFIKEVHEKFPEIKKAIVSDFVGTALKMKTNALSRHARALWNRKADAHPNT